MVPPVLPVSSPAQPGPVSPLKWSHFKPEFACKPDENVEAHLSGTNDSMDTHAFHEGVKVQRFYITFFVKAELWYESLRPVAVYLNNVQAQFRQIYSRIGNNREKLFYAWRSFHFDENIETINSYVTCIRKVEALLEYGEPQVPEMFKNTLPSRLY